jgi:transposase
MLNQNQRMTILELHSKGVSHRQIARLMSVARISVKRVIRSESTVPPAILRPEKADPYRQEILHLYGECKGNLVRVHEELLLSGADLSYPTLTAFCRRHHIGQKPKVPAGQYHFEPSQEMQHDTSPHRVHMGGKLQPVQTASAVLCYSRMLFFQFYPRFRRFECKIFLTEALKYFDGSPGVAMIDNTHVVVLRGTGIDMIPVPEMAAFSERYGFKFRAHAIGNANRSGRVERPFSFIENNFLAGRKFTDWNDLNRRAREWCDQVNGTYKKHIRAVPRELFAIEKTQLKPLPVWVPEVYLLHHRIVDVEGYVSIDTNRYSAPVDWIGRQVEIRETKDRIIVQNGPRQSVSHERIPVACGKRITLQEHRPARGQGIKRNAPRPEEKLLGQLVPEISEYVADMKKHGRKYTTVALRQLLRMAREYPREDFLSSVRDAAHYGLYDIDRLERMILRRIANQYFQLNLPD